MIRIACLVGLLMFTLTQSTRADFQKDLHDCDFAGDRPELQISACSKIISSNHADGLLLATFYSNRGVAFKRQGQLGRAIRDYSEAVTLDPNLFIAWHNRANAFFLIGEFGKAIKDYNQAINLKPDFAEGYNGRGNLRRAVGNFDRAFKDYDSAVMFAPGNAKFYADRGLAYDRKGDHLLALSDYQKSFDLGYRHQLLLDKLGKSEKERPVKVRPSQYIAHNL
jgi:tetratricopeptide (TPR) repeat protein